MNKAENSISGQLRDQHICSNQAFSTCW